MAESTRRLGAVVMRQVIPPTSNRPWYRIRFISGDRVKEVPQHCFECPDFARVFAYDRFLCLTHAIEKQMLANGEVVIESPEDSEKRKHRADWMAKKG